MNFSDNILEIIKDRIKTEREKKGFTQAQMAEKLFMDEKDYNKLENQGKSLTLKRLIEISIALEVEPGEIGIFFTDNLQKKKVINKNKKNSLKGEKHERNNSKI